MELILDHLADGWTMEDVFASYPRISRQDVLAALSFASEIFKEETFVAISKVPRERALAGQREFPGPICRRDEGGGA